MFRAWAFSAGQNVDRRAQPDDEREPGFFLDPFFDFFCFLLFLRLFAAFFFEDPFFFCFVALLFLFFLPLLFPDLATFLPWFLGSFLFASASASADVRHRMRTSPDHKLSINLTCRSQ